MNRTKVISIFFFLINLVYFPLINPAHSQSTVKTAPPEWIIERNIDVSNPAQIDNNTGSIHYYLDDQQSLYDQNSLTFYTHQIFQLRTLQAIEQMGTLQILINPAYQNYNIHHLDIIRDGTVIDMLPTARLTIDSYNSEANTPDHEGQNIVQIYIADLRRDDIVDFAYSILGQNPAFGLRTIGMLHKIAAIDVNEVYRRIIVPKNRIINIKTVGGHETPNIQQNKDSTEYEWYWNKIDQFIAEVGVPIWFPSYPIASYSDFQNWNEVSNWAFNLFKFEGALSEGIKKTALDITKDANNDLEKLIAIYSFMQSEIRYTGLEIGRNGYRPFSPDEVIKRRYGDCKDQTVLLIALLKALGIDSSAALVNSLSGKIIENYGITPLAFNHAIVKATIGNDEYWLDPTNGLAKDKIADLTPPRYMKALLLNTDNDDLTDIPLEEKDPKSPQILVTDHYNIPDGVFGEISWIREAQFSGTTADYMKNSVDYIGVRQLGINLRQSHLAIQDGIENKELTSISEDQHFFKIKENYTAPKAGKYDETRNLTTFSFAPRNIAELLASPPNYTDRDKPFALYYPARRKSVAYFDIPGARFYKFDKRIQNPYFTFQYRGWYEKNIFKMIYEFETHQDHVPAEGLKRFKEDIDLILGEMITYVSSSGNRPSKIMLVYQPVLNQKKEVIDTNNMDVYQKIETFVNTDGLNYLESSREEVLDILEQDDLTTEISDEFFSMLILYAIETNKLDEAYFYHDLHVNGDGILSIDIIISLIQSLTRNDDYERAAKVTLKEIKDSSGSIDSPVAEYLHSALREIYWNQKDFIKLKSTLEHLTDFFPKGEMYFRELRVVYDILKLSEKAAEIKAKMYDLEYNDPPIQAPEEDSKYKRVIRPLVRNPPSYPYIAARQQIEGYVLTEYTVSDKGDTKDCRVIESSNDIFENAACKAVEKFYYYPIEKDEVKGDIRNYRSRIEFKLE